MKNKQESSNTTRNARGASNKQTETQNKTTDKGGCGCKKSSSTKNCG